MKMVIAASITLLLGTKVMAAEKIEFSNCAEARAVAEYYGGKHTVLAEKMRSHESYRTQANAKLLMALGAPVTPAVHYLINNHCK